MSSDGKVHEDFFNSHPVDLENQVSSLCCELFEVRLYVFLICAH